MSFSETVEASLSGAKIKAAFLVEMQFSSETMRLSNRNADLKTLDSRVWRGLRGLGAISGLERAVAGTAPQAIFSLSGVAQDVQAEEQGDPSDYVNQPIGVSIQFFRDNWSLLDNPYAIWGGTMQTVQDTFAWDDGNKAWTSVCSLTAESWFIGRSRPPYAFYSHNDQQLRFAGDLGLQYMSALQNMVTRWPNL